MGSRLITGMSPHNIPVFDHDQNFGMDCRDVQIRRIISIEASCFQIGRKWVANDVVWIRGLCKPNSTREFWDSLPTVFFFFFQVLHHNRRLTVAEPSDSFLW